MTNTLKTYSMRKIYLIRHCLAKCPGGKRICLGQTDVPLGKEGRLQAVELKKCFKSIPYTAVFTSPLLRAYETAVYLGDPVVINSLKEAGAGDWDGLSFDEITEKWPELYEARGKDPNIPIPGAEDINLVLRRRYLHSLARDCHEGFLKLYIGYARREMPRYKDRQRGSHHA